VGEDCGHEVEQRGGHTDGVGRPVAVDVTGDASGGRPQERTDARPAAQQGTTEPIGG
jgi:hypothetical protein